MELTPSLKDVLSVAYPNNSFGLKALNRSLNYTLKNSFGYLYRLQRSLVEYEELHYFSNDVDSRNTEKLGRLYLDKHLRACIDVEYDLIDVTERESYRRSKFYLQEFSFMDIINNPDIFKKVAIVIIDDQVIYNYKIKMVNGNTHIILPYKRNFVLKDERNKLNDKIIYKDHKVQIITVDNIYFHEFESVKTNMVVSESEDPSVPYEDVTIYLPDSFRLTGIPDNVTGIFFASFLTQNTKEFKFNETSLVECQFENTSLKMKMPRSIRKELQKTTVPFKVHVMFFNDLYKYNFYTGKDYTTARTEENCLNIARTICADLAVITKEDGDLYDTPIPVENFMILSTEPDAENTTLECNEDAIELHYPNIYQIVDRNIKENKQYQIYYFYKVQKGLKYTDLHYFYYDFLEFKFKQPLDQLVNDIYYDKIDYGDMNETAKTYFKDLFAKVFQETAYNHEYGDIDYTRKYLLEEENIDKRPKEYKIERMREFIRQDPWVLKDYVLHQNKVGRLFHLFTVNVKLEQRLRTDTSIEFEDSAIEFPEPRYVFAFSNGRKYGLNLVCSVFVDGLHVDDLYQERKNFLEYLYIPASMVTTDSFIEIEVFDEYDYEQPIRFGTKKEKITVEFPMTEFESVFPLLTDVYFYDDNEDERQYISDKCFRFTSIYEDYDLRVPLVTTNEEEPIEYTRMVKVTIQPLVDDVIGKDMILCVAKKPYTIISRMEEDGYPQLIFDYDKFKPDIDYLQLYINGRLLPKEYFNFIYSTSQPMLQVLKPLKKGDIFYTTISPYRNKRIYYQEELEKGNPFIDLTNVITKPFDIRYYDVYLNGRRLGINNVFALSPTVITLVNIKSIYNLEIFERDRDWEYFGLKPEEFNLHFTIPELMEYPFVSEKEKNEFIKEMLMKMKVKDLTIVPNENFEEREDHDDQTKALADMLDFYFYELIPKTYSNPDLKQFDYDLVSRHYPTIANYFMEHPTDGVKSEVDRERKKEYPKAIILNPDKELAGAKNTMDCHAFTVGHRSEYVDDVLTEDMLMNQTVEMIDDTKLITGGEE